MSKGKIKSKMAKEGRKFDLEDRLIDFTVMIADVVEGLPNTKAANHIGGQMIRSGSSPALNYGEAQEAESKRDFIHKMGICRKELRETKVGLKIIVRRPYKEVLDSSQKALSECLELLAIFSKSIDTAKKNLLKQ
jgi:four helix bundle protein